jgi:inner membrane protein
MDTITQGLLGAVTAQLGFRQRIGRDAGWLAAGAAIVPDLDILIYPLINLSGSEEGEFARMVYHRGLSHSLLMVPVLALMVTFIWWWFRRGLKNQVRFRLLYGCIFVALLSHPLLDWCTSYGTQLFAPLSSRRFALDALPIIDIIYTPLLILTLTLCYVLRRAKIGTGKAALKMGWIGFMLSVAYIMGGYVMHQRAISALRNWTRQHEQTGTAQFQAYPQIGTIFLWRVTRQDEKSWTAARINLLYDSQLDEEDVQRERIMENPWIRQARQLPQVQTFEWFAMGRTRAVYWRENGKHVVDFHDMRYGQTPASLESLWSARVTLDRKSKVLRVERVHHFRGTSFKEVARRIWRDMWQR